MKFEGLFKIPKASKATLNKVYRVVSCFDHPNNMNKEYFIASMFHIVFMNWDKINENNMVTEAPEINPVELYKAIENKVTFCSTELKLIFETRDLDLFFKAFIQKNKYGLIIDSKGNIKVFDENGVGDILIKTNLPHIQYPPQTISVLKP